MATFAGTSSDDYIIATADSVDYRGGEGNDTYILTNLIPANATIIITDTEGANKIQLADGLTIASSSFLNNAAQLTLSNGAKVQITGASSFTYDVGANATSGDAATAPDATYAEFATALGATVPAVGGAASAGTADFAVPVSGTTTTTPTFSVSASEATVTEGGTATFTVSLSAAQGTATTVAYALAGTGGAVLGTDTTTVADATLTFAPGEITKTVTVPVTFDTTAETGEGMTLTLSSPSTGTDLGTSSAAVAFADPTTPTYTLTSDSATQNDEGDTVTFTVTPSGIVLENTTFTYSITGNDLGGAATAATATDFSAASGSVTFAAGDTAAKTVTVDLVSGDGTESLEGYTFTLLDSTPAAVTSVNGQIIDSSGSGAVGQTFTLTTTTDDVDGTSGNDTILGEFATSPANTANASDQIDGGAGTDTIKLFGTFTASQMPLSVENVENLQIATLAAAALDLSSFTKAATGIENIIIDDASAMNNTITTTTGQSLSLATGNTNTHTAGAVTWAGSATDTSLNLTLNGYQGGTGATPVALTITGALATTQNIASTGSANKITTLTLGATTNKVVVTGDQALSVTTDLVSSAGATTLKTVDASANTGGTNITLAATTNAAFAFTGGTGADSVKFADNGLGALTSGAQLDGGAGTADKLAILDTALTATEIKAINAATNFEILGLNAAVAAGVDASLVSGFKTFSIDTAAAQTLSSLATGSNIDVTVANANNLTLGTAVGVSDVSVDIGTATTTGIQGAAVLSISGATAIGISSNGTNAAANTVTTLTTLDNSVVTLTGSNDLTIGTISNATTTGHKIDASAMTGKFVMTNGSSVAYAAGSSTGDVILGGSAADTLLAGTNSTTLTGNAGNDTFNVEAGVAGGTTNANITTITDFAKGDKIDFSATAGAFTQAAVSLTTAASEQAAIDLLVAGNNSDLKWGVYNGNTYIAEDLGAGATLDATDFVVKLSGVLDLSTSTLDTTVLTFA